jgi:hypothetical protein
MKSIKGQKNILRARERARARAGDFTSGTGTGRGFTLGKRQERTQKHLVFISLFKNNWMFIRYIEVYSETYYTVFAFLCR